jgi:ATP-binding cassette subfamily B protein
VSAIRDATWIIVLDEGRVVEQGKHTDLLAAGGRYWSLLSRQQLEESIEDEPGGNGGGGGGAREPEAGGPVTELAAAIPRGTINA